MEVEGRLHLRATQKNRPMNYATMTRDESGAVRKASKGSKEKRTGKSKKRDELLKPKRKTKKKLLKTKIPKKDLDCIFF